MDRRNCLIKAASMGLCPTLLLPGLVHGKPFKSTDGDEDLERIKMENLLWKAGCLIYWKARIKT